MTTPRLSAYVALLGVVTACAPTIDLEAERAALRETDEAWAAAASAGTDVELMASYWSDDATVYPNDAPMAQGTDAILAFVRSSLEIPGFSVNWQPQEVVVAESGDLGWTSGTNEFTVPNPEGGTMTIRGHYVAVWQKDADGNWKCVVDMFNTRSPGGTG